MTSPDRPSCTQQSTSRRLPKRRDDSGLTTLEWLLIVAAVAGLAALAVVLVTNVVGGTSEQIEGSSARKTAAQLAASDLMRKADRDTGQQPVGAKKYGEWANYYTDKCNRFKITYSDIPGINVYAFFSHSGANVAATSDVTAASITTRDVKSTTTIAVGAANEATAQCLVP